MSGYKARLDIVNNVIEKSVGQNWVDGNRPSWVVNALMGAGIIASISIAGCCSSPEEKTTVTTPPPRKGMESTKPIPTPRVPPKNTPPSDRPKPIERPIDIVRPLYGVN